MLLSLGMAVLGGAPSVATPARAAPGASDGPASVSIQTTSSFGFDPASPTVNSLTVAFTVSNPTTTEHTFTLSSRVNETAPTGTTTSNASGSYFSWPDLLADKVLNSTGTVTFTVTFPTWGSYQFICRIHYPTMQGSIDVVPASTSSGGSSVPPWTDVVVLVVLVAVLGVAVVVVRRRRRPQGPAAASEPGPRGPA